MPSIITPEKREIRTFSTMTRGLEELKEWLEEENLEVLPTVRYGGPFGTVPELLFEKKGLIPDLQQLLIASQ